MRLRLLALVLMITGCDALAPSFDAAANTRVTSAYQSISEILAKAELGAFTSKSSFAGQIDAYAGIISALETAKLTIEGDAPSNEKLPAFKANQLLVGIIEGCLSEVKSFSALHKEFGIPASSGATQPVRVACDETVKAVGARGPVAQGS